MPTKLCLQHDGKNGNEARPVHIRGRCKSCYESIRREIRNGRMTEAGAVKQGWLLPSKQGWLLPSKVAAKAVDKFDYFHPLTVNMSATSWGEKKRSRKKR